MTTETETAPKLKTYRRVYVIAWFFVGCLAGGLVCGAAVFQVFSQIRSSCVMTIVCSQRPPDDQALRAWLSEQPGIADLSIRRRGDLVQIRFSENSSSGELQIAIPPWQRLGYRSLNTHRWVVTRATPSSMVSEWIAVVPRAVWFAVLAIAWGLGVYLRRRGQPVAPG